MQIARGNLAVDRRAVSDVLHGIADDTQSVSASAARVVIGTGDEQNVFAGFGDGRLSWLALLLTISPFAKTAQVVIRRHRRQRAVSSRL